MSQKTFIDILGNVCVDYYGNSTTGKGMFPSVVLGQTRSETGWPFTSEIARNANNILGMDTDLLNTTWNYNKYWDGASSYTYNNRSWRKYPDVETCVCDYMEFQANGKYNKYATWHPELTQTLDENICKAAYHYTGNVYSTYNRQPIFGNDWQVLKYRGQYNLGSRNNEIESSVVPSPNNYDIIINTAFNGNEYRSFTYKNGKWIKMLNNYITSINNIVRTTYPSNGLRRFDLAVTTAFIGDSRICSMGFSDKLHYELITDKRLFATWGGKIIDTSSTTNSDKAATINPQNVVFGYGINDIQSSQCVNSEGDLIDADGEPVEDAKLSYLFVTYKTLLNRFHSKSPTTNIYVLSILTSEDADHYEKQEQNIDAINDALKDLCEQRGFTFIDATDCYETRYLTTDKIHFTEDFYTEKLIPLMIGKVLK